MGKSEDKKSFQLYNDYIDHFSLIPDAKCNGDMHAALDYAQKVKHEQKDFLNSQALHQLY